MWPLTRPAPSLLSLSSATIWELPTLGRPQKSSSESATFGQGNWRTPDCGRSQYCRRRFPGSGRVCLRQGQPDGSAQRDSPQKSENHKARAYIETNTPVFGKEKLQFLLQYRVETMRFTPPKLAFGTISPGEEKQLVVEAIQGDASPITGEMRLKDRLEWVEVKGDGHGRIEILLNGTRLADQGDRRVPNRVALTTRGDRHRRDFAV